MQESNYGLSHYSEVSEDVFVHSLSSYFTVKKLSVCIVSLCQGRVFPD